MLIQLDHVNYVNRGAELMLEAIIDRLNKEKVINPRFVLGVGYYSVDDVVKSGLYIKPNLKLTFKRLLGKLKIRRTSRIKIFLNDAGNKDINVVLNAAGYYYSDKGLGVFGSIEKEVSYYKKIKRNNAKVILLPQAFGPFESDISKKMVKSVFGYIDLMYARDRYSYNCLVNTLGISDKIKIAPDFTNLLDVNIEDKELYNLVKDSVIIIPNHNMLTHTDANVADNYIDFLNKIVNKANELNKKVIMLNHEGPGDRKILKKLGDILKDKIVILDHLDARAVKAVIGCGYLVITSRFHGLVSSLSQAIPVLCTSWSHKYEMLLEDYNYSNAMMDVTDVEASLVKVENLLLPDQNAALRKKLESGINEQKKLAEKMWEEVINCIKG